jgi:hypothetical protein
VKPLFPPCDPAYQHQTTYDEVALGAAVELAPRIRQLLASPIHQNDDTRWCQITATIQVALIAFAHEVERRLAQP